MNAVIDFIEDVLYIALTIILMVVAYAVASDFLNNNMIVIISK